jgi:hypothetical protein
VGTAVTEREPTGIATFLVEMPIWLSAVLIIGGLPVLVAGLQALIRRRFPALRGGHHNDVAGFLLAVIGVVYAVVIGFMLIDLHENYDAAEEAERSEALTLMAVAETSRVLGAQSQRQITGHVLAYERAVIASWPPGSKGSETPARALERLLAEIEGLRPASESQEAFVWEATRELMDVSVAHHELHLEAREGFLEPAMWLALLISSVATLAFCLLFGLENAPLHYLMVAGAAIVVAVNLFLIVQFNYPFKGELSVRPDTHHYVIRELTP